MNKMSFNMIKTYVWYLLFSFNGLFFFQTNSAKPTMLSRTLIEDSTSSLLLMLLSLLSVTIWLLLSVTQKMLSRMPRTNWPTPMLLLMLFVLRWNRDSVRRMKKLKQSGKLLGHLCPLIEAEGAFSFGC